MLKKQLAIKKGFKYYCVECLRTYKELPTEQYEDENGKARIVICPRCGCDLFAKLEDDAKIIPSI